MQLAPAEIPLAAKVEHGEKPTDADRHLDEALAPRTSEGVGDQHGKIERRASAQLLAQARGRRVGVLGQQDHGRRVEAVRFVDSGIGADVPLPGFHDQMLLVHAHDAPGLAENDFDDARVLFDLPRDTLGGRRGLYLVEPHHAPLCLGYGFLTDDQQIAVASGAAAERFGEQQREVAGMPSRGTSVIAMPYLLRSVCAKPTAVRATAMLFAIVSI